jgi:hypothetical protein
VAAWLADQLERDGLSYAISGALALAAYGVPRMTKDVDLAVFVEERDLEKLFDALERGGCLFDRDQARADVGRIALFRVRCGRVLVDLFVSFHPHHHESLGRRRPLPAVDGRDRWFLSPEDLAVHKLALLRAKDRSDLEGLFAVQGRDLDVDYIRRWVHAIAQPGDPRREALEELARR